MTHKEKQLVFAAQADPSRFNDLFSLFFDDVYAYVARRVGSKHTVQLLVQDIFLASVKRFKKFSWEGHSFLMWLYRLSYDHVSRWQEVNKEREYLAESLVFSFTPKNHNVSVSYDQNDYCQQVRELFKDLSFFEQEIVRLKFFERLSNQEIAYILDLSPQEIGNRLYFVLQKCQQLLINY